jgi:hypothetical protein
MTRWLIPMMVLLSMLVFAACGGDDDATATGGTGDTTVTTDGGATTPATDATGTMDADVTGTSEEEVTGTVDGDMTGTADSEGTGTSEIDGTGTAEMDMTGTPEEEGTGTAETDVTGTAEGTETTDGTSTTGEGAIGEPIELGDVTITVDGVEELTPFDLIDLDVSEGNVLVGVEVTIENTGDAEVPVTDLLSAMAIEDQDGERYGVDLVASGIAVLSGNGLLTTGIEAGGSASGTVGFAVPEESTGLSLILSGEALSDLPEGTFEIGEEITAGDLTVTPTELVEVNDPGTLATPDEGNRFVGVVMQVENAGEAPVDLGQLVLASKLEDASGEQYGVDFAATLLAVVTGAGDWQSKIDASGSLEVTVGYQVPEDAEEFVVTFESGVVTIDEEVVVPLDEM